MQSIKEGANEGCKVLLVLRDQSYENQTLEYQRRARKMKEWLQVRVNRCVSKRIKKGQQHFRKHTTSIFGASRDIIIN
jgi:hypothetical protein